MCTSTKETMKLARSKDSMTFHAIDRLKLMSTARMWKMVSYNVTQRA